MRVDILTSRYLDVLSQKEGEKDRRKKKECKMQEPKKYKGRLMQARKVGDLRNFYLTTCARTEISQSQILVGHGALL
jgi:hypothetical protein